MNESSRAPAATAAKFLDWARTRFLGLWQAKGGGAYGLGYALAFVALELRTFTGEIAGSDSAAGFVVGQLFGYLIRISVDSVLNALYALAWPILLLQSLGGWAAAVVIGGFLTFEYIARARIDAWFPELKEARAAKVRTTSGAGKPARG